MNTEAMTKWSKLCPLCREFKCEIISKEPELWRCKCGYEDNGHVEVHVLKKGITDNLAD